MKFENKTRWWNYRRYFIIIKKKDFHVWLEVKIAPAKIWSCSVPVPCLFDFINFSCFVSWKISLHFRILPSIHNRYETKSFSMHLISSYSACGCSSSYGGLMYVLIYYNFVEKKKLDLSIVVGGLQMAFIVLVEINHIYAHW